MSKFSCILIGNESLATHCGDVLLGRGHDIHTVVTKSPAVRSWADSKGLSTQAPGPDLAARLGATSIDWLFSIANLALVPDDVLALAGNGAINFHDGPLPGYAGLNVPVWAMLNGEPRHGITWHYMKSGVDEGDILEERGFEIGPDETALTLNAKCFAAALEGFEALLPRLEAGVPQGRPQDLSQRRVYARADRPAAAARLDFTQSAEKLARLVRALDHGNYVNPLSAPKLLLGNDLILCGTAQIEAGSAAPGQISALDADTISVGTGTTLIRLGQLTDTDGKPVDPAALCKVGDVLPALDAAQAEQLSEALARVAPGEGRWRRLMTGGSPAELAEAQGHATGQTGQIALTLSGSDAQIIAGMLVLVGRLSDKARPFAALTLPEAGAADAHITGWVPLSASVTSEDTLGRVTKTVEADLGVARKYPGFARDLIAREPSLGALPQPDLGLRFDGETLVEGTALTLLLGPAPAVIYDTGRISQDTIARLMARLELLLGGGDSAPVTSLPILPEQERALVLQGWNDTATAYDRNICMHQMFAEQAARTPDATALVFEDRSLSYAQLNRAANQAAHVLQDMGVAPGTMVGLHTSRSAEMLIGALAILKAGGAYIPMDPAFPADRLAYYLEDSAAPVIVTQSALTGDLPPHNAQVLEIDRDPRLSTAPEAEPQSGVSAGDLAYMIYTSGSTGKPKGVMVEHRNVANFFTGMDDRIPHDGDGVWLAVTSLSFDISVLELFYTLARGYKLIISGDESRTLVSSGTSQITGPSLNMDFSLYFWGAEDTVSTGRYDLLLEGAKFADDNGFCAIWTPERHFHAFGGSYPNPSVTGAAVASITRNLAVRAGSIVSPLHHPARIAEEWAIIDNLTGGRVGLAMASGWQPDDFILRPENTPPQNKPALAESIDLVRKLWAGEEVPFPTKDGGTHAVVTQPRPISKTIPLWVTTAGNPATWAQAGEMGANVLTHLLGQSIDEVGDKIKIYHDALRKAGHDPANFKVTLMLHTFLAEDRDTARDIAREPMKDYLRSAAGLIKQYAWAFPAFKKPEGAANPMDIDLGSLEPDELEAILDFAFERYFNDSGFFGTVEDCIARAEQVKAIGVDEIACLIEYGIDTKTVLEGLRPLARVVRHVNRDAGAEGLDPKDFSIAAQIARHGVSHLQCTPSMARMICINEDSAAALARVKHLMIGGEALPGALVAEINALTEASIENMYGPTETTIWSTTETAAASGAIVNIGTPIANTQVYVLDEDRAPVPVGMAGELYIGGDGVTRGYWQRPELTAERFLPDPFVSSEAAAPWGARMYRTGDLVRWRDDGKLDFFGRTDHQVKIRGYRIELGEIEARIETHPNVTQAVVIAREDQPGDLRLVGYLTASATVDEPALRKLLAADLPDYMIPAHFVTLDAFPLTPNKKVDRKALPAPAKPTPVTAAPAPSPAAAQIGADVDIGAVITEIWQRILGISGIGPSDNFFTLGGHSLLAVQAHREMRDALGIRSLAITDIFRFPTVGGLVTHLGGSNKAATATPAPATPEAEPAGSSRADAMSRRRQMRANRANRQR